jgi:hypothetical protein
MALRLTPTGWARSLAARSALPRIPLHGLRHTYATLALSSGVNPRIASGRLGHSTAALTLDIYSHVPPQAEAEGAERIAALVAVWETPPPPLTGPAPSLLTNGKSACEVGECGASRQERLEKQLG